MDALIQQEASGSVQIAPSPTDSANPAGEQVRQELSRIMSDPTHPMHEGYSRGDRQAMDHVERMYTKAYGGGSAPGETGRSMTTRPGETPEQDTTTREDRAAAGAVDAQLRLVFGDRYDSEMSSMRVASQHLFATAEGAQALAALAPLVSELGPLAEVRAIRFLAELGQLLSQKGN
jgi:hypothetical protein